MDIAIAIESLLPSAKYTGVVHLQTPEEYASLNWVDERPKPTWADLETQYNLLEIEIARENQLQIIQASYQVMSVGPLEVLGLKWFGGYISGIKLDAAKRPCLEVNAPAVTFHDFFNEPRTLSYSDASKVIHTIGFKYNQDYDHQAEKCYAIIQATTIEQIKSIVW